MSRLMGRRAIVTGAGRGIGRAIAMKLAAEGAQVLVNDLDVEPADATVEAITAAGGAAFAFAGDITEQGFADRMLTHAIQQVGGVDILVNNAGYIWNSTLIKSNDAQWDAMLDVHVRAPVRILRAVGAHFRDVAKETPDVPMRKVVNISSLAGVSGAATQASYSAAKSALVGLTKTLAKEWGRYRVNVNCVAFGHIETRLTQNYEGEPPTIQVGDQQLPAGIDAAQRVMLQHLTPLGRPGTVEEAAGAVFLFCMPESDYITGEILVASGGLNL